MSLELGTKTAAIDRTMCWQSDINNMSIDNTIVMVVALPDVAVLVALCEYVTVRCDYYP